MALEILKYLLTANKNRYLIFVLALLVCSYTQSFSQAGEERVDIYFKQDSYKINPYLENNEQSLMNLRLLMDNLSEEDLSTLSKIEIHSWTSPEPGVSYNDRLSMNRSKSIKEFIHQRWEVPDSMVIACGDGIAWAKLRKLVAQSEMQYRDEVLYILDNVPEETWKRVPENALWPTLVDSRLKRLMDLRGGRPYKYMYDNIFSQLRYGSQVVLFFNKPVDSKFGTI